MDRIKEALLRDPDFEPQEGRTKEESAWAIAWSRYNQMKSNEAVYELGKEDEGFEAFKKLKKLSVKQTGPNRYKASFAKKGNKQ